MNHALLLRLKDARYKVLVACRPLAPAKTGFNLAIQAIIDTRKEHFKHSPGGDDEMIEALKGLMLQD